MKTNYLYIITVWDDYVLCDYHSKDRGLNRLDAQHYLSGMRGEIFEVDGQFSRDQADLMAKDHARKYGKPVEITRERAEQQRLRNKEAKKLERYLLNWFKKANLPTDFDKNYLRESIKNVVEVWRLQ